jgi:hypothetical protein
MASIISTKTSGGGGIAVTGDTSGVLQLASNDGTTAVEIDASQVFKFNSGYGSVATAYGCRAWVNFNGTGTVAIRASGNVSSITDVNTGEYRVNFTNAMPNANYAVTAFSENNIGVSAGVATYETRDQSTTQTSILKTLNPGNGTAFDSQQVFVAVFR